MTYVLRVSCLCLSVVVVVGLSWCSHLGEFQQRLTIFIRSRPSQNRRSTPQQQQMLQPMALATSVTSLKKLNIGEVVMLPSSPPNHKTNYNHHEIILLLLLTFRIHEFSNLQFANIRPLTIHPMSCTRNLHNATIACSVLLLLLQDC